MRQGGGVGSGAGLKLEGAEAGDARDSLGALSDGMLGELTGKARADGGLDMKAVDGIRMIVIAFLGPYCVEPRRKRP